MPKAVFSYSFIQLYYLPYIRLKPELPGQREEQSLELPALLIALLIAYPACCLVKALWFKVLIKGFIV